MLKEWITITSRTTPTATALRRSRQVSLIDVRVSARSGMTKGLITAFEASGMYCEGRCFKIFTLIFQAIFEILHNN